MPQTKRVYKITLPQTKPIYNVGSTVFTEETKASYFIKEIGVHIRTQYQPPIHPKGNIITEIIKPAAFIFRLKTNKDKNATFIISFQVCSVLCSVVGTLFPSSYFYFSFILLFSSSPPPLFFFSSFFFLFVFSSSLRLLFFYFFSFFFSSSFFFFFSSSCFFLLHFLFSFLMCYSSVFSFLFVFFGHLSKIVLFREPRL